MKPKITLGQTVGCHAADDALRKQCGLLSGENKNLRAQLAAKDARVKELRAVLQEVLLYLRPGTVFRDINLAALAKREEEK